EEPRVVSLRSDVPHVFQEGDNIREAPVILRSGGHVIGASSTAGTSLRCDAMELCQDVHGQMINSDTNGAFVEKNAVENVAEALDHLIVSNATGNVIPQLQGHDRP
ncbi:unnamed protein product, partial [Ilex paraguariensis]